MRHSKELIISFNKIKRGFSYLQTIDIHRIIMGDGCSDYCINLILTDYPFYEGDEILVIKFTGIKDIKIGYLEGLISLLITIEDISFNQLEGLNYKVKEIEEEIFSFYCNDFTFEVIKNS